MPEQGRVLTVTMLDLSGRRCHHGNAAEELKRCFVIKTWGRVFKCKISCQEGQRVHTGTGKPLKLLQLMTQSKHTQLKWLKKKKNIHEHKIQG